MLLGSEELLLVLLALGLFCRGIGNARALHRGVELVLLSEKFVETDIHLGSFGRAEIGESSICQLVVDDKREVVFLLLGELALIHRRELFEGALACIVACPCL